MLHKKQRESVCVCVCDSISTERERESVTDRHAEPHTQKLNVSNK